MNLGPGAYMSPLGWWREKSGSNEILPRSGGLSKGSGMRT